MRGAYISGPFLSLGASRGPQPAHEGAPATTTPNTTQLHASVATHTGLSLRAHHDYARFFVCWRHGQTSPARVMMRPAAPRPSILPLPAEVVAQIKSSTTIVSLNGVVLELFKNALDAKATKIEATIDYARGACTVEDDGVGISPLEFRDEGGLGKLYCM
jgi:hypothetical protein